tara:strand:- start:117 stop:260 length:144 start_codon:yes stop_codon:yes gene_type:complete
MARKDKANFEVTDVLRMFPTFVWKAELKPEYHRKMSKDIIHKPAFWW